MNTPHTAHEIDILFSDQNMIQKYLEVEISLAKVQAEMGIIPKRAAEIIASNALLSKIDIPRYKIDYDTVGFPIVGLLKQLDELLPNDVGEYLHWGATTQDIMDTGLILILNDVIDLFEKQLTILVDELLSMTEKYKSTPMIGRSQMQHAIPITFGYKVAGWLAPFLRHKSRLTEIKNRLLQLQFGGAVGTLASLGEDGFEIRNKLALELGLKVPVLAWHTQRDNLVEFISFIGLLSTSSSKVAQDILLMSQSEIGEIVEKGMGVSSTMPNKRNPIITQKILVAGKLCRSQLQAMMESSVQDHERGSATWQNEWHLIPAILSHGFVALKTLNTLLQNSMIINERAMIKNLELSETVYAEGLMMELASSIGRQKAHDLTNTLITKVDANKTFRELITANQKITDILSNNEIKKIFSGKKHREMAIKSVEIFLQKLHVDN